MKLKCPHCGYDGSREPAQRSERFLYLEDIVCWRKVIEDDDPEVEGEPAESMLYVDGLYQSGEGFDDGTNPRLMCGDCLEEFLIPEGAELEFI